MIKLTLMLEFHFDGIHNNYHAPGLFNVVRKLNINGQHN